MAICIAGNTKGGEVAVHCDVSWCGESTGTQAGQTHAYAGLRACAYTHTHTHTHARVQTNGLTCVHTSKRSLPHVRAIVHSHMYTDKDREYVSERLGENQLQRILANATFFKLKKKVKIQVRQKF